MLRQAWSEVRLHPGRFVSTILAVAIAVAFLAGSAVLVATEGQAQGRAMNVSLAEADVVVTGPVDHVVTGMGKVIASTPGVAASAPVRVENTIVTSGHDAVQLQLVNVPPEALRWARLTAGRWPKGVDEVVLSAGAASSLGVALDGRLRVPGGPEALVVVGLTNEPSGLFAKTAYASDARLDQDGFTAEDTATWTVLAAAGTTPQQLVAALTPRLAKLDSEISARPGEVVRAEQVAALVKQFDVFANLLWAFAAVSLLVGMITIANTFTITLAQRRRQIGLLRAVGASGAQVRSRFLIEAVLLGIAGSLVGLALGTGLAAAVTAWTGALFWGLSLPSGQLLLAVGLGVVATVVAAFVPILRGTRVAPLEALQPVLGTDEQRRSHLVRAVVCALLATAGAALAVVAVSFAGSNALLYAVGAGALISAGVLFGGPLFVPSLLLVAGHLLRRLGTVPRLAADNADRHPRRATATATALMLAVGLIVTLQVATASIRLTVLDELSAHYPVDLQVAGASFGQVKAIGSAQATRLAHVDGVDDSLLLSAAEGEVKNSMSYTLIGYDPAISRVTGVDDKVADDQVLVDANDTGRLPKQLQVSGSAGKRMLTVVGSRLPDYGQLIVSSATLAALAKPTKDAVMWLSVPDRNSAATVVAQIQDIMGSADQVSGAIAQAALYEQVLNILLAATTGLLAVAVLIALIGVSNTLGLSVLERSRESALLRALGLQARSLRAMLTIEALQVTGIGVLVGLLAGAGFGWLAVAALVRTGSVGQAHYAIDIPQTLAILAIAVLAAALASVLPGRRAAEASPVEALAEI